MAKLVILNQGMTGRSHDLTVDRTTVGRVEDNTFHIADASVSSHHCEIHLRGADIVIRDLNSTNGTFINNDKVSEAVLKPGQTLRLGHVELKLDTGDGTAPAAPAPTSSTTTSPAKPKQADATMVMPRGVSLDQLEQGGQARGLGSATAFSKKKDKTNLIFIVVGVVVGIVIIGLIIMALMQVGSSGKQ
jgi:pSer/pThr/pTyr-binding forkhead associated (FHA) protein